jgi:hypothetical protein
MLVLRFKNNSSNLYKNIYIFFFSFNKKIHTKSQNNISLLTLNVQVLKLLLKKKIVGKIPSSEENLPKKVKLKY